MSLKLNANLTFLSLTLSYFLSTNYSTIDIIISKNVCLNFYRLSPWTSESLEVEKKKICAKLSIINLYSIFFIKIKNYM
jgi:hypothetical protein